MESPGHARLPHAPGPLRRDLHPRRRPVPDRQRHLRLGAAAKLEPLADYLDANPGVRVRLDGFTDSIGTDAANLRLSHNRAKSVANALSSMGVRLNRLEFYGHGEATPVASNNTAAGRQLNRRVEVSLIGQRTSSFN